MSNTKIQKNSKNIIEIAKLVAKLAYDQGNLLDLINSLMEMKEQQVMVKKYTDCIRELKKVIIEQQVLIKEYIEFINGMNGHIDPKKVDSREYKKFYY
ncbi:hypothetical protein [Candidatus Lokiarchaeum ossiferum]|uniref:hypothetical protein n=1 Tax=Candidatus Lokiarchaeum ossiferum TaxID=2951803 RepID=UPI00352D66AA